MSLRVREIPANAGNYGAARREGQVQYLVIHYTGNSGDTAVGNGKYYQANVVKASAHYFVDDREICRSVPELRAAWAVGGSKWSDCGRTGGGTLYGVVTNTNSLSVELCGTARDGSCRASEETLHRAAALCRELMERYHIPPERVARHFDVTGKHCPAYMMEETAWKAFKDRLAGEEKNLPSPAHRVGVEWAMAEGILRGNGAGDLMLSQPLTREQFCTMLYRYDRARSAE